MQSDPQFQESFLFLWIHFQKENKRVIEMENALGNLGLEVDELEESKRLIRSHNRQRNQKRIESWVSFAVIQATRDAEK